MYPIACHYQKAGNDSRVEKLPSKAIITAEVPQIRATFTRPNFMSDFYLIKGLTILILTLKPYCQFMRLQQECNKHKRARRNLKSQQLFQHFLGSLV